MWFETWSALVVPAMAAYAGYLLTGRPTGVALGFLVYAAFATFHFAARFRERRDYWASKLAMLKAETESLQEALAEADARRAEAPLAHDSQVLIDAYRARLGLLQAQAKAVRAGYASQRKAGPLGHFSETQGGLLPDGP